MPAGQQITQEAQGSANAQSSLHDLFALTDEQILEIEPEGEVNVAPGFSPASSPTPVDGNSATPAVIPSEARDRGNLVESPSSQNARHDSSTPSRSSTGTPVGMTESKSPTGNPEAEPPAWLAAQMKDPWTGEEAKELWNGVQQARQEAAAYRAAFATPEDARALKEMYPGGVNEARAAAERARVLDDIDRAYFAGDTNQREELAQRMLREDPAAFREMVIAGLRALEEAEKGSGGSASAPSLPRLARVFGTSRTDAQSDVGATLGSHAVSVGTNGSSGGASPAPTPTAASGVRDSRVADHEGQLAAYTAFEKAANEDLERSVGAAIERTLAQVLPNISKTDGASPVGAQHAAPLQERLSAAVRQDVEAALKGDRQLGEQIAQILSSRRFDGETRAQVVRLIDDRARQLVPVAAKRVLSDWTQTTLAAHRGKAARADAASARREVLPVNGEAGRGDLPASPSQRTLNSQSSDPNRGSARPDARRVDYRKLSDEQILDL